VNTDVIDLAPYSNPSSYYDSINSMEMNISDIQPNRRSEIKVFYKNQEVESGLPDVNFLAFEVNIHKDLASDVLTLNRNKIKDEYIDVLYSDVMSTSFRIIMSNFYEFESDDLKVSASMFLEYYNGKDGLHKHDLSAYGNWRDVDINLIDQKIKLGNLLNKINSLELIFIDSVQLAGREEVCKLVDDVLTIELVGHWTNNDYTKFIIGKIVGDFKGVKNNKK
jgi:hypothetical protein